MCDHHAPTYWGIIIVYGPHNPPHNIHILLHAALNLANPVWDWVTDLSIFASYASQTNSELYSQSDCIPLYHNIISIIIVVYMNDDSIHCTIATVMSMWRMCVISCAYKQSRHNHSGHSVRDYHEHNIATWTCQSQIKGVNIDHQFNSANKKKL